uniref:Ninjurin 1 n=1 Tax=Ornithorhynchus anatinus TaxID=9258 RepID=A0A6I8NR77_ORNAN
MDSAGPEEFELNGEVGAVERLPSRWRLGGRPINVNHYANKKSAAESMLDIALLMANASQLKAVIEQGPSFSFFTPLIVLISISLVLQVGVGVLLIFLGKIIGEIQKMQKRWMEASVPYCSKLSSKNAKK